MIVSNLNRCDVLRFWSIESSPKSQIQVKVEGIVHKHVSKHTARRTPSIACSAG